MFWILVVCLGFGLVGNLIAYLVDPMGSPLGEILKTPRNRNSIKSRPYRSPIKTPSMTKNITSIPYRVENLRVKESYPNAWGVCGLIRNLRNYSVKGYVVIEFLDSSGKSYFTTRAYVKAPSRSGLLSYTQPDWIEPDQVGAFEYWEDPKAFRGVSDFRITFREVQ
jgi:hypothetical protein